MMKSSPLQTAKRTSPLEQAQHLKNGDTAPRETQKSLTSALPLTSLIDAFSIIVIYLIIGTQNGGLETIVPNKMKLPLAESGSPIEAASIVRIERGVYFIDDKAVSAAQLGRKLYELKQQRKDQETEILIQADRAMNAASLDPLLRASSEAGLQKLRFAVIPPR